MIPLPKRHEWLATFYRELAHLLEAGIPIIQAISTISSHERRRRFRHRLLHLERLMQQGYTFSEALDVTGTWLPDLDRAVIRTGEISGRLPDCLTLLANYHELRARLLRNALMLLFYPMLILFFYGMLFPIHLVQRVLFNGELWPFVLHKLSILALLGAAALAASFYFKLPTSHPVRLFCQELGLQIPLVRNALLAHAMARLSLALEALLEAGVPAPKAWDIAAESIGLGRLARRIKQAVTLMGTGATPSEALAQVGGLPDEFLRLYAGGELSGKLDDSLRQLFRIYSDRAERLSHKLATRVPIFLYVLVIIAMAYQVLSFWIGYARMIEQF